MLGGWNEKSFFFFNSIVVSIRRVGGSGFGSIFVVFWEWVYECSFLGISFVI